MSDTIRTIRRVAKSGQSLRQASTAFLVLVGAWAGVTAGYFGYALSQTAGPFAEVANSAPLQTWVSPSFLLTVVLLGLCGVIFASTSLLAAAIAGELKRRLMD